MGCTGGGGGGGCRAEARRARRGWYRAPPPRRPGSCGTGAVVQKGVTGGARASGVPEAWLRAVQARSDGRPRPRRDPGGTQEGPRRDPGGTQEGPRRDPGGKLPCPHPTHTRQSAAPPPPSACLRGAGSGRGGGRAGLGRAGLTSGRASRGSAPAAASLQRSAPPAPPPAKQPSAGGLTGGLGRVHAVALLGQRGRVVDAHLRAGRVSERAGWRRWRAGAQPHLCTSCSGVAGCPCRTALTSSITAILSLRQQGASAAAGCGEPGRPGRALCPPACRYPPAACTPHASLRCPRRSPRVAQQEGPDEVQAPAVVRVVAVQQRASGAAGRRASGRVGRRAAQQRRRRRRRRWRRRRRRRRRHLRCSEPGGAHRLGRMKLSKKSI